MGNDAQTGLTAACGVLACSYALLATWAGFKLARLQIFSSVWTSQKSIHGLVVLCALCECSQRKANAAPRLFVRDGTTIFNGAYTLTMMFSAFVIHIMQ